MLNDFLPMAEIEMDADYEPLFDEEEDEDDEEEDGDEEEHDQHSREDDEAMGESGSDEEEADDDDDDHHGVGEEEDTDEEMTEADRAQLAAYLATQPELDIIEADDIDTHGAQLFWRSRE